MSTGYGDRPVARAIKIKHAGLNLTGPALAALCVYWADDQLLSERG